ncbi:tetratricopeptide repeat protein [Streptomyces sp. NPDC005526]|uniref:tetratricopeptide repeat protein n=1 Tax=Streptomyces sp. NPDC005526 TaxID=3156885 RepID=UPI0033BF6F61
MILKGDRRPSSTRDDSEDDVMRWGKLGSWSGLSFLVLVIAGLTAVPGVVKAVHLPKPGWTVPIVLAVAGVLLGLWKPLLSARSDVLAARVKARADRESRAIDALRALPTRKDKALRVEEVTSRAVLNIHKAIPLPAGAAGMGLSDELPEYVGRDIDADLRTYLTARSTTGGFALLVGPAAAGKTRTAYEALRHVLPDWRLLMPATGAEVNDLAAVGADLSHSVIWLNETQDFLTGSTPLSAGTVRRLLADTARPVILIGTIWPDRYDQLRGTAEAPGSRSVGDLAAGLQSAEEDQTIAGAEAGQPAETPGHNARDVLHQARPFAVSGFSGAEWERAAELARRDPRLALATTHRESGMGMTQILSAAPELIHRWEQADNPYGKAVLTAAVTARRCGHPDTIPNSVLQPLASHFLTGTQRATATAPWYDDALDWACRPVHHAGDIAPLRPHAKIIGHIDGYRVTDILTHHIAPTAPAQPPDRLSADVWDTLIATVTADACNSVGYAAYVNNQLPQAAAAWTRAGEAGHTEAMFNLGILLSDQGDDDGGRIWWTRAAEQGHTSSMRAVGALLHRQGDTDGARTWYARAADRGHTDSMGALALLLSDQGDTEGALTWWTRAAEGGHTVAMTVLAVLLKERGDTEGALTWWTRAAEGGHTLAMTYVGLKQHDLGDTDGARTWWSQAANAGHTDAMVKLGALLRREEGDTSGARSWWTQAANAGNTDAMFNLAGLQYEQGDTEEALTWWTRAAEGGNILAMVNLGVLQYEQGDNDGARTWWTRASERGDATAASWLAQLGEG